MSYHTNDTRLVPGKGHSIIERDENGGVIGTYTGYWNPKRQLVTLYPDYRHPALYGSKKLHKRQIYDGLVKCKKADTASSTASGRLAAARSQNGSDVINVIQDRSASTLPSPTRFAGEGYVKSQTSRAMKDIIGQERIKF